jgi:hypothetical protein
MGSRSAPAPLFIVGAPRSGTSLLYRTLALHPDAAWINNYVRRVPLLPELAVLNRVAVRMPRTRSRVWFGEEGDNAYRYAGRRTLLERVFPQPVEGEPVFTHRGVLEDGPTATPDARQSRLAQDLRRMVRASGGNVLVSKRIGHNRRIPLLHGILPESRFVVVTRDGRAVARSLSKVDWWPDSPIWWYGGTPTDWAAEGRDPVELCATHWVREVEAISAGVGAVPAGLVKEIRYEELVRDPRTVLTDVAAFAGLGADPDWDASLARLAFSDKNVDARDPQVERFQEPTLRKLGYLT